MIFRFLCFAILCCFFANSLAQEVCGDCQDNDGDGLIDCYDSECYGSSFCEDFVIKTSTDELFDENCVKNQVDDPSMNLSQKWSVEDSSYSTFSTFAVADVNKDGVVDIITVQNQPLGSPRLIYRSGVDGAVTFSKDIVAETIYRNFAIGDVDNDGFGEIIGSMQEFPGDNVGLVCFEHDGSIKWHNKINSLAIGFISSGYPANPGLADFDGDFSPEVYVRNRIYNANTGALLARGFSSEGVPPSGFANQSWMRVSVAADVLPSSFCGDCDGLELICGDVVYAYDPGVSFLKIESTTNNDSLNDGYTAVADFDGDDQLDVIVNHGAAVYVWNPRTGDQIGNTFTMPPTTSQLGSTPTVADFDNDGEAEIVISNEDSIYMLDNNMNVVWVQKIRDGSANLTPSSSAFDFNCDGFLDIVNRTDSLRIFNGKDGSLEAIVECRSGTLQERPTIADIDKDGHTDILIGCTLRDIVAFSNPSWAPSRHLMNQYNYNITNIDDNLRVPCKPQQNPLVPFELFNSFLIQAPLTDASGNTVCYNSAASLEIPIDQAICEQEPLELFVKSQADITGYWINVINDDTFSLDAMVFPDSSTNYLLDAEYKDPCFGNSFVQYMDSLSIEVVSCEYPFIPNVFTPNEDGENDVLKVLRASKNNFNLSIYDQKGKLIYQFADNKDFWDGTYNGRSVSQGVYVYKLDFDIPFGKHISRVGNIQVLR